MNALIAPDFPWFVLPVILIVVAVVNWYGVVPEGVPVALRTAPAAITSVGFGLLLGGLGIWLTGLDNLRHGLTSLPGSQLAAPQDLREVVFVISLLSAAFTEEAVIRGRVQLRLQTVMTARGAEILSDCVFVALHAFRFGSAHLVLYVVVIAVINGRLTSLSQRITWAIVTHLISNGIVAAVAIAGM
jgi:membrane protease YdiL (CAAX protease family)